MKVLSLNTHSLIEENYPMKLKAAIEGIAAEAPDIIAMQEVNQTIAAEVVKGDEFYCSSAVLKADNYGLAVYRGLKARGLDYYWAYCPCHIGYSKYDEGVALFSKYPFEEIRTVNFSAAEAYNNYQTRKAILARVTVEKHSYIFVSTHMGWWKKDEERFVKQWDNLQKAVKEMAGANENVIIMGDLNSPAHVRGEGYDYALASGYEDSYDLAAVKDDGNTAFSSIDGWKDKEKRALRIDYVLVKGKVEVMKHQVIFNGKNRPVVSDHYGIIVEMQRS